MHLKYLEHSYPSARQRFLAAAAEARAELASHQIPCLRSTTDQLYVDTAYVHAATSSRLLIVATGLHGVEGYAGSACITYLLESALLSRLHASVLLIHAANPWGFANDSRNTEENVDLNRNFVDYESPLPSSEAYSRLHKVLCRGYRPGIAGAINNVQLLLKAVGSGKFQQTKDGITRGQFAHRDGLFYGGSVPSLNRTLLEKTISTYAAGKSSVRMIDVHTGLGRSGEASFISHRLASDARYLQLNAALDGRLTSLVSGTAVSSNVEGLFPAHVEKMVGPACLAVTQEFGVTNPLSTLWALRADAWLRSEISRVGCSWREQSIRMSVRKAFCRHSPEWEAAVIAQFGWLAERLAINMQAE